MGLWDQQSEDLKRKREEWVNSQEFCFQKSLASAQTEEEVKAHYIRYFLFPAKIRDYQDLRIDNILFEFKYSVDFKELYAISEVIAQALYYVRREAKNITQIGSPKITHLVIADKDEAAILAISDFEIFYNSDSYDWKGFRPSSPDPKLIEAIQRSRLLETIRIFHLIDEDDLKVFENLIYSLIQTHSYYPNSVKEFSEDGSIFNIFILNIRRFSHLIAISIFLAIAVFSAIIFHSEDDGRESSNSRSEVIDTWEQ